MEVKPIKEKSIWENFLLRCQEKTFLHSWNWGEFQEMLGNKIWRLGVYEAPNYKLQTTRLVAACLAIKIEARRGKFLLIPHGPVVLCKNKNQKSKTEDQSCKSKNLEILLKRLKKIAKKESCSFIRIAPIWIKNEGNKKVFRSLGFKDAPIHVHPELTWQLDLTPSNEELLKNMRKTTRYLIRRAPKDGITVFQSKKVADIEQFMNLYKKVVKRQNFVPFSLDYLKKEFLAFGPDSQISVFFARYKNEVLSSAIVVFWQGLAFYHHGASDLRYSKIPCSYAVQWAVIQEAKKRGCKTYNFWGIAPDNKPHHPWKGLSLFKIGFGGYKREYVKTQDLPLSWNYYLTYIFETIRRKKRGL